MYNLVTMPEPVNNAAAMMYPLPAFYFKVVFASLGGNTDTSFQEVRGLTAEMETEEVVDGGENRYVLRLPKQCKQPQLELKRGITKSSSPLMTWCKKVLSSGLASPITPTLITVMLLNENGDPVCSWSIAGAYPVKWEIDEFSSTKNDVAIETITMSYTYCERLT